MRLYIGYTGTDDIYNGFTNYDIIRSAPGVDFILSVVQTVANPEIYNQGDMIAALGSTFTIAGPSSLGGPPGVVDNTGDLDASGGTLNIRAQLQQSGGGILQAENGGTVELYGRTDGGTVEITNATLAFGQVGLTAGPGGPTSAGEFAAPLALEGGTDFIDFGRSDISVSFSAGTLSVSVPWAGHGETQIADLQLVGSYTASEFSVQGNDVVYLAPSAIGIDVVDTSTGQAVPSVMSAYSGPVAGLDSQYVNLTSDNLNVTATAPNAFIHVGSGMDGLTVASGNNVLDGSGGSDFMIGGTGDDTFYMDDRGATAPIFSTIVNFHSGDAVTLWGVNASDFTLTVLNNQGAAGAQGVDLIFSAVGHADVSFVLAGYTSTDLSNGRLSMDYGQTPDMSGLPGSEYVTIRAT